MYGPSFFPLHFLSISISFPKLTIVTIYVFTWLATLRALVRYRVKKSETKILYLRFSMHYSLYNWTGDHEITKYKKIYIFASEPEKGHANKHKKICFSYFQQCACVNTIYFAPVFTTTYCMKNNKTSTRV